MNINAAGRAMGLILNMLDVTKPTKPPVPFVPQKPEFAADRARFSRGCARKNAASAARRCATTCAHLRGKALWGCKA